MSFDPTPEEGETPVSGLAGIHADAEPRAALEGRVVNALRDRGLLKRGHRRSRVAFFAGLAAAAAVAAVTFLAGLAVGRGSSASPSPGTRFVLFLYGGDSASAAEETARVEEYRTWARSLRSGGRLVAGEKLANEVRVLGPGGRREPAEEPRGFFTIAAPDWASAMAVAGTCPHLKHGGRLALRRIEPT